MKPLRPRPPLIANPKIAIIGYGTAGLVLGLALVALLVYWQANTPAVLVAVPYLGNLALGVLVLTVLILIGGSLTAINVRRISFLSRNYETELQTNAEQLRQFFELAPIGKAITTVDGQFVQVNRAFCELVGYSEAELSDRSLLSITHPDDVPENKVWLAKILSGEVATYHFNKRYIRKDGSVVPVFLRASLLYDTAGQPAYIIGQTVDLTGQIGIDLARQQSEKRFQALVESSADVIATLDAQANILYATPTVTRILGHPLSEFIGHNAFEFVHPEDTAANVAILARLLEQPGGKVMSQMRFRHYNGEWRWIEANGDNLLTEPGVQAIVVNFRDITERKQAEEALRQQNEYFAALHETSLSVLNRRDLTQLLEALVERSGTLLNTQNGFIDLVTADNSALETRVGRGECVRAIGRRLSASDGLSGQIWQTNQSLSVDDYQTWAGRSPTFADIDIHAIVGVPLRSGGRVIGVLGLVHTELGRAFEPAQMRLLERFAEIASLALDNARLFSAAQDELAERNRANALQTAVYRISQAASDAQSLDQLFRAVHAIIQSIMPANNFYIALYDEKLDLLSFPYFVDEVDKPDPPQKPGRGLTEYVLRTGKTLLCDAEMDAALQRAGETDLVGVGMSVWLGVPLIIETKTIGVLAVQDYKNSNAYRLTEQRVLEFVSNEIARAIDRKRAAAALEHERNFALQMMNTLGQGVTVTGPAGRYDYVNPVFARLVGRTPDEVTSRYTPRDLTAAEDHPLLEAAHGHRKAGETTTYEVRLLHRDGSAIPVLVTGSPRWQGDQVIGAVTVVTDLGERKRAEEAVKNSEKQFRVLAENIPGVIYQCRNDERYTMLYLNDAVEALTGYPKEDFLEDRLSFFELYHPVDLVETRMPELVNEAVAEHQPFHLIYRVKHQSGEWRWVEEWGTGVFGEDGGLLMLEGFLSDITERKEAEEALRRSEQSFRLLAENVPGVIFQCRSDDRYTFLYLNDAIEDLTGYPKDAFLKEGLSFFDLYHPDDAAWMPIPSRDRVETTWQPYHIFYRIRHKAGEWRWVEEWGTAVTNQAGQPQFLEGFMIDITERKRAEDMLARNSRELVALDHMGQAVAASLDLTVVLKKVIDEITPLLQAEGMVVLLPEGDQRLVVAAVSGQITHQFAGRHMPHEAGVAGEVMRTHRSVLVSSKNGDRLYREVEKDGPYQAQSLVAAPLILGGSVIGVMEAIHTQPVDFTADDQRLLEAAANWAAIAIGNARQHERIQRRLQESEAMAAISRALNETLDLPLILQLIVDSARKIIPTADRAVFHLFDEGSQVLRPMAASDKALTYHDPTFKPGVGIAGRAFAEGTVIKVGNSRLESTFINIPGQISPVSVLTVPVQSALHRLGTLTIDSPEIEAFSGDDERLLINLGVQAALAIENARLFDSARRRADELNTASEILRMLNATNDIQQAFPALALGLKTIAHCERISLGLYDDSQDWYTVVATDQPRPELAVGTRLEVNREARITRNILAGRVHQTSDLNEDMDAPGQSELVDAGYRSRLNLPLKAGGQVIGSLNLSWLEFEGYSMAPQPLLEQIADAMALATEKIQLLAETTEALAREQRLTEITRIISGSLGLSGILDSVARLTAELVRANAASLALLDEAGQNIVATHYHNFGDGLPRPPLPRGQGIAWEIVDSGRPKVLANYAAHPNALPEWTAVGAKAFVGVPVAVGQEILGILGLFRTNTDSAFSARDVALAESVGLQAGIAIQNARLFEALTQEKRQIELLYDLSQNLTTTLDLQEVAEHAIQLTTQTLGLELSSVNLIEPGTDRIHIVAMTGYSGQALLEVDRRAAMQVGKGLGGHAILARKPLIAPDLTNDPYWNYVPGPDDTAKSAASVPLLVGDEVIGVMTLLSRELNGFPPGRVTFLAAVASSVALSLQNARLYEEERDQVEALTALHETGLELITELDLPTLLRFIVERAVRLLEAPMGALSLLQSDTQTLEVVVNYNLPDKYLGVRLKVGEGAAGRVALSGAPLIVDDYEQWEGRAAVYHDAPFRSIVLVPVKWRNQVVGVISVNHVLPYQFNLADTELVGLFADQAAVAVANAHQHRELQRRLQESDAIASISRALNETLDLQRLLTLIVETAHRIIPSVQRAVIHLLNRDAETLRPAAVSGEGETGQSVIMRAGEGVAGQVIAQGVVINVQDTLNDPRYLVAERISRTRSLLVAPVQSGRHRLGTLSVNSNQPNAFSGDDERLLGTLGAQAALAIYNAQLFEDTRRQLDELVLLNTIALVATEATTENELIQRATRLIDETFYPIVLGVMLIDETGNFLLAHDSYRGGPPGYKMRLAEGVTGRVATTGQPWLIPDVRQEPRYFKVDPIVRSELCVPLKAGNAILGVINAESERLDAFSETDFRLFTTLAGQLAIAIQKLRFFRDLEQALKQEKATRAQLVQSEKLAAMGRLVASVAHELNNPLQAIQNALYLVRQEPALSLQAIDDLQVAATESDRMAELIKRLRETYRPAASEEFRFESLNTIVTEVQKLIGTHLRHNQIEFKFEADPDMPYIPCVRDQLKQVLLNLSLNAVEAMPEGGQLTIRTSHDPAGNDVILTVQDTGEGIPIDIVNSVFDPFFTTKESGTGLGLTITYDIIQRHKGRVEIASEPGQGATFTVWLPTVPGT